MTKEFTIYQNGENISRFGQIDIYKCKKCNVETFVLGLYPEIDGIGTGVVGLTGKKKKILLITRLTGFEYTNFKTEVPENLEKKISDIFIKNDFKHYVRKTFTDNEFNKKNFNYQCEECNSQIEKKESLSFIDFVEKGGKIWSFENYEKYKITNHNTVYN